MSYLPIWQMSCQCDKRNFFSEGLTLMQLCFLTVGRKELNCCCCCFPSEERALMHLQPLPGALACSARHRRDEPLPGGTQGNAISWEMLIPCLEQLLESHAWHPKPTGWAHLIPTELYKRVGAELCPSYFHWIRVLEALFFTVVSKISGCTCLHSTGASIWFIIPIWKRGSPGWELCFVCWGVELGLGDTNKKGTSQLQTLPICWDPSQCMAAPAHMCRYIKWKHESS